MKVKPIPTPSFETQLSRIDDCQWSVARLAQLSKDLEAFDLPLAHINMGDTLASMNLRELAGQVQCVNRADMSKPIILDEDGKIMDGRHRIAHAIVNGMESVKAVRFETNPNPCRIDDE